MSRLAGNSRAQPTMNSSASRSRSRSWKGKGSSVSNSCEIFSTLTSMAAGLGAVTVLLIRIQWIVRSAPSRRHAHSEVNQLRDAGNQLRWDADAMSGTAGQVGILLTGSRLRPLFYRATIEAQANAMPLSANSFLALSFFL